MRADLAALFQDHNFQLFSCLICQLFRPNRRGQAGEGQASTMITSGTSGALVLAFLALLNPGDECIIPDPYFVAYPHLATLSGAKAVCCDTYPDFRLTAERVEPPWGFQPPPAVSLDSARDE